MADIDYVLYDTAPFGVAANTEFVLFQVPQGADATHVESFTNSRGPGALNAGEKFVIKRIGAAVDYVIPQADVKKWFVASFLEVRIADQTLFKVPLACVVDNSDFGGSDTTTPAANGNNVGLVGDGYMLDPTIIIPAGVPFRVRVWQGTALTAANSNIKIMLYGLLSLGTA